MTWVVLDDKFFQSPKAMTAGRDAAWLWVAAIGYCNANLTDGFVTRGALPILAMDGMTQALKLAQKCVEAGLFEAVEGGYRVHDFLDWNDCAAVVKARRDANAKRVKKHASKRESNAAANASTNALAPPLATTPSSFSFSKGEEPPTPASGGLSLVPSGPRKPAPASIVFDHWRNVMDSPRSVLDAKRRRFIEQRLTEFTTDDLCAAIDGCRADAFSMGENDRHQKFNGIEVIFRDAAHVEKFMALAAREPERTYAAPYHREADLT